MSILSQGTRGQGRVGWPKPGSQGHCQAAPGWAEPVTEILPPPWPWGQKTWGQDTFLPISREHSQATSCSQNIHESGEKSMTAPWTQTAP